MAEAPVGERKRLRVSELTRYVKYLIEHDERLAVLSVQGEVTEFSRSGPGHIFFTLKDPASMVSCVFFRNEVARNPADAEGLKNGDSVVVHGCLTVYEPKGRYQVIVERVFPLGAGAIFQRFERLKARLTAEGLFAEERKRSLPAFPRKIALITSPDGRAYHDVLQRLRVQYPFVNVLQVGVSVQGDGAADEMAFAIDIVNRLTDADVILLVRGGGAAEDLAAFNEERLARAIFASRTPIVTGVGHEADTTIADFVADRRAATPSLAAAVAVPDVQGLVRQMADLHTQLTRTLRHRLRAERERLAAVNQALVRTSPQNRLRLQRQRSDELAAASERALAAHLRAKRARLEGFRGQLEALDPLAILRRGYAVLTDEDTGQVVSRREQAKDGKDLRARVSDGEFGVRVTKP